VKYVKFQCWLRWLDLQVKPWAEVMHLAHKQRVRLSLQLPKTAPPQRLLTIQGKRPVPELADTTWITRRTRQLRFRTFIHITNRMISTLWIHSESGEARSFQAYAYMHFWRPTLQVWTRASSCIPSASCNVRIWRIKTGQEAHPGSQQLRARLPGLCPTCMFSKLILWWSLIGVLSTDIIYCNITWLIMLRGFFPPVAQLDWPHQIDLWVSMPRILNERCSWFMSVLLFAPCRSQNLAPSQQTRQFGWVCCGPHWRQLPNAFRV
jgi:hypothetical protein